MDLLFVFEGWTIQEPWVIMLVLSHNCKRLKQVPFDETNGDGPADVGETYGKCRLRGDGAKRLSVVAGPVVMGSSLQSRLCPRRFDDQCRSTSPRVSREQTP